jgi:hypothetical protein
MEQVSICLIWKISRYVWMKIMAGSKIYKCVKYKLVMEMERMYDSLESTLTIIHHSSYYSSFYKFCYK